MTRPDPLKGFHSSPEIIRLAVMMYFRFGFATSNILCMNEASMLAMRRYAYWWRRFGSPLAAGIRKRRIDGMTFSRWRWHHYEIFVKIDGERHYLCPAVDHVRDKPVFIGSSPRELAVGRTVLAQNPTSTTLRDAQVFAEQINAGTPTGGAQKFPFAASVRISLSSVRSDTAFLSRSFSF